MNLTRRGLLALASVAAPGCRTPAPRQPQRPSPQLRLLVQAAPRILGLLRLIEVHIPEAHAVAGLPLDSGRDDFLLCEFGQGAPDALAAWRERAGKPYGMFAVRMAGALPGNWLDLLKGAEFVWTGETLSLARLKRAGLDPARTVFVPDPAFGVKLANETAAKALLASQGLQPKQFVVAPAEGPVANWVRRTGNRVVENDRSWPPNLACSIYRRAIALVGTGADSPILAAAVDTPALWLDSTGDGQIWKDIGLSELLFDAKRVNAAQIARALAAIQADYAEAQVRVHEAVIYARKLQADAMGRLRILLLAQVKVR